MAFSENRDPLVHSSPLRGLSALALGGVGAWWLVRAVHRRRELEAHLCASREETRAQERRLNELLRATHDLHLVLDAETRLHYVSPSAATVLGHDPRNLLGRALDDLLGATDRTTLARVMDSPLEGDLPLRLRARHADGHTVTLDGVMRDVRRHRYLDGWVATLSDVSEELRLRGELTHQALHDPLTGLANRRLFTDRLGHALRRRDGDRHPLVVMQLDLHRFQLVNDSRGHAVGDNVLRTVGERLSHGIRTGDTAARVSGDEFAVLMEDIDVATAHEVATRMMGIVAEPVLVHGEPVILGASVGLAKAVPGTDDQEDVLRHAEVALKAAKARGNGTLTVYDPQTHMSEAAALKLQSDLARGIARGELVVHYQPTVDLQTSAIHSYEALVRWQHRELGLLSPAQFIPLAEESGLIVPLGHWVLREACRAAAQELTHGELRPLIAVNVAAPQLAEPDFCEQVLAVLAETGLEPQRLKLEITESMLLKDRQLVVDALTALRESGVLIAVDDFGTGYSALSYLADLPVDVLKVDKSFVDQVCGGGESLVDAIIGLADSLGLATVAEGVETAGQARWLSKARCGIGQGFLWSRPVPLTDARALLVDELTVSRYRGLIDASDGDGLVAVVAG